MLSFLAQAAETKVREFTWVTPVPAWVFFLAILPAVIAFAVWMYRRENLSERPRDVGRAAMGPMRGVLIGLRVLVILVLLGMLAEPVLRTTKYKNLDSTILVLVDDSLSMDIADKYSNRNLVEEIAAFLQSSQETVESTRRYDLVSRVLGDKDLDILEKLRGKGNVVIYTFARDATKLAEIPRKKPDSPPLEAAELALFPAYDSIRADERVRETRIGDAIRETVSTERGGGLGGTEGGISAILLVTDGQQTPGGLPLEDVARRLGQRSIPIHAIGIGNPDDPKDIRAIHLEVNDIVLAGDRVPFDAAIVADGFDGERVRVDLKLDDEIVDTRYFLLEGGGKRQSVRLEHKPQRQGDFVATVEVERKTGEIFVENNAVSKPIKVLDQKIRVLYAEGPPRWEYRYLKNALIRDSTMDAQVFLFSADPSFIQESTPGVPALAEFPTTREQIFSYHVIILGDVDPKKHLKPEQIAILRDFVQEAGGGLVFVAGDNANPSRYGDTELYAMLPVEVPERDPLLTTNEPITTAFNVELTPVGKEHTVMRLDNDAERNTKLWENKDGQFLEHLPGFYWFAEVGRAKKGAVVLARHPNRLHPVDQTGLVIFGFMNYGKGRTFFSGVDNTWRWRAGVDNQYFYRFWGQVIRFCATGRLLGKTPRYMITTDKLTYSLGDTVNVEARVFDAEMKPSTERTLTVHHQARATEGEGPVAVELALDPVQGQGAYHGAIAADRLGLHDLWIGTETERLAFRSFEVAVPALELRDPRKNKQLLEAAAKLSGGAYHELHQVLAAVDAIEGESRSQEGDVEDDPLWDEMWVLFAFTGIIAAEWILRKVAHLL